MNDLQPGLVKVLNSESNGATTRYLHDISGIHSQQTPGESWVFPIMDALGSLRGVVNPTGAVLEGQHYALYGTPFGHTGTAQTAFGFTGEITDSNGLLNLRARYYVPGLGVFPNLDPVEEGNRYGYVGGDVVNRVDPSGAVACDAKVGADRSRCLDAIADDLWLLGTGATLGGVYAPDSGLGLAGDLLTHYLFASGKDYYGSLADLKSPDIKTKISDVVRGSFESTWGQSNNLSQLDWHKCCTAPSCTDLRYVDLNILQITSPEQFIPKDATWWWENTVTRFVPQLRRLEEGGVLSNLPYIRNPWYLALGSFTVASAGQSSVQPGIFTPQTANLVITTPVVIFDHYDWCYGQQGCKSSGTHPIGKRVGEFFGLEKYGRAKQFNAFFIGIVEIFYAAEFETFTTWRYAGSSVHAPDTSDIQLLISKSTQLRYPTDKTLDLDDWNSAWDPS